MSEKFKHNRRKFEYQGRTVYEWEQSIDEVNIFISPPEGITAKMIACDLSTNKLILGIKGNPPFINEEFYSNIKVADSFWTFEDDVIHITVTKMNKAETWFAALKGHMNQIDTVINEEDKKKIMLERFQEEHPGFDFSSAEFSGQSPDPRTFLGGLKK
ncbi:hypothetical protein DLAC_10664 [Tieghemostelium lacteum]|uniref:CS domain-containing protein n=1 Tax=Tieghemostelium lacteum TaxID=361077 RepID=A0A151Z4H6_TIELA|nr:hypothetical protein DLAC_10664 [Tieghemostelium lacteum]|eukprot:KYQ88860.1 hypothetical protein DLAC_10664 [Tieghemostelium lacteum]